MSRFDDLHHILPQFSMYDGLLKDFGKQDLENRFCSLLSTAKIFVSMTGHSGTVEVCEETLFVVMVDYCSDILRLKTNHGIDMPNEIKTLSYESYWILRRKPLRLVANSTITDAVYANERFVISRMMKFLADDDDCNVSALTNENLKFLYETLFYFLKYRKYDAHAIEMILLSFYAGVLYQNNVEMFKSSSVDTKLTN